MPARPPILAIVGATGAVGREMLDILAGREYPTGAVRLLASERSAGSTIAYRGESLTVNELTPGGLAGVDVALFSAGSEVSRRFARAAAASGVVVIDNSSAFRMEADVPLVIPEVNGGILGLRNDSLGGIIANPNCSTIILLMALTPIRNAFGVRRVVVSTYQAASGAGAAAMRELSDQSADVLAGRGSKPAVFNEPCAFNVFSHDSPVDPDTGRNLEERKMAQETRKIWDDPGVAVLATCIRVPVLRAHAESIHVELKQPATLDEVREVIRAFAGLLLVDDPETNDFPTSLKAASRDDVLVGRIRPDPSRPSEERGGARAYTGFELFVAGDQLRKGAALNAIQIMDLITHPSLAPTR